MDECKVCLSSNDSGGKRKLIGIVVLLVFIAIAVFLNFYGLPRDEAHMENVYRGTVSNSPIPLRKGEAYTGTVLADLECRSLGEGTWFECTAMIAIDGFEEPIYVTYKHDMAVQPCLGPGDRVSLVIKDNETVVTVISQ